MYIIDKEDIDTINYCNDSDIYYIFYDYYGSKFSFSNQKEIDEFSKSIYEKMEIYEPNLKLVELFQNHETSTDLSLFKKFYLGKKRKKDDNGEEHEVYKNYEIKELNQIMTKTKNGYKNLKAILIKGNSNDYKKVENTKNPSQEEKAEKIKIPKKWGTLFKEYDSYQIITKNTNVCNTIFGLPVFYIYKDKYLIIKNDEDDDENERYSFYNFDTGEKLENEELQNAIESLNIFSPKSEKSLLLDAYFVQKN